MVGPEGDKVLNDRVTLRDGDMAHLQADLDAKAHDAKRGHGLRMLRQIWARMAKGESGYRLELWKQQKKRAEYARLHEIERHLRHVSQDPDKQMAVRILRQQAALTILRKGRVLSIRPASTCTIDPAQR